MPPPALSLRLHAGVCLSLRCLSATIVLAWGATPALHAEPLDRHVAEWAILMGGSVQLVSSDDRIRETSDLPSEDFRLERLDLVGTNVLPPDLERLVGLKALRKLNLPGPMWNPRSGARKDYSRELRHLAGFTTLEELTFSYTFLASIKFK